MARSIRNSVFETNSSATHSMTIYLSDYSCYTVRSEGLEEDDEIYVPEEEINNLLDHIPLEILEKKVRERKENENSKK